MRIFHTVLCLFLCISINAQCGDRYIKQIFSTVDVTSDILYGNNVNYTGGSEDLYLDFYEPSGDTEPLRPLIVLEHGGSFVGGTRTDGDVVSLSEDFAKMGYACTSISYRIGMAGIPFPGPDSVAATEAVIRAYHDMKAAIRFFWKDARENGNTYRIDTNNIFIGGSSAGGFAAVHVAYLDKISEMPDWVDTTAAGLDGGLDGNSGNPGYPSDVKAVFSLAGALRDTSWIESGDLPLLSMHATLDETVPYGTDIISVIIYDIIVVSGSSDIHRRLNNVGVENCFYSVEGTMHPVHNGGAAYYDTTVLYMRNFLASFVCSNYNFDCFSTESVGMQETSITEFEINLYPNPAQNNIWVDFKNPKNAVVQLNVYNLIGELVSSHQVNNNKALMDISNLGAGSYFVEINGESWHSSKSFVKY